MKTSTILLLILGVVAVGGLAYVALARAGQGPGAKVPSGGGSRGSKPGVLGGRGRSTPEPTFTAEDNALLDGIAADLRGEGG